jgi:hypothetical protein
VAARRFGDFGGQHGSADRLLDQGGIQLVPPLVPGLGITPALVWGERSLPGATLAITWPQGVNDPDSRHTAAAQVHGIVREALDNPGVDPRLTSKSLAASRMLRVLVEVFQSFLSLQSFSLQPPG